MDTIKSSDEISRIFSCGRRFKTPFLTLIVERCEAEGKTELSKQHDPRGRVAFIAGKKLGNAVWRNAAKRRMRSLCGDLGGPWAGYDVIFLAKSTINEASYSKVVAACERTIRRSPLGGREEADEKAAVRD
ncbi:MAG: ribonuclease P protein component [Eggerthellaceae bacterium]|nr:ribonuclease P protein component [Eggerthellaceae bacterium]